MSDGIVYLIGAGCGDYDLITLRGYRLLKQAHCVIYDYLIDSRLLTAVPEDCEKICVGKRAGSHSMAQEDINSLLVSKAKEGKTVVRLKGGDPFVFGRGGEEALFLAENNICFTVVPGITSAVAAAEMSGIPVTHRGLSRSFHVITAHTSDAELNENINKSASLGGTLIFLMGLKRLDKIVCKLTESGKNPNTPVAVISNGATSKSYTVRGTLADIVSKTENDDKITSPAVIVVGETAAMNIDYSNMLPICGVKAALTGTDRFIEKISCRLKYLGAEVYDVLRLEINEYADNIEFDNAIKNISRYKTVVLTSPNGAEIFIKRLRKLKYDVRNLYGVSFAVIGRETSAVLREYGIYAEIIPEKYTSAALAEKICEAYSGGEVLILRAEKGSKDLTDILTKNNVSFTEIKTYDVAVKKTDLNCRDCDFIVFASKSGVRAFFENGGEIPSNTKIVAIGAVTADAVKCYSSKEILIPDTCTADGIVNLILREKSNEKIQKTEIR